MPVNLYPVIMCGGAGTRLWPLSRSAAPKQFHQLISDKTMLEETLQRVQRTTQACVCQPPIIICSQAHQDQVAQICAAAKITPHAIILEPVARNTAPVTAVAASFVAAHDPDGVVLLLPADHNVQHPDNFWASIEGGLVAANEGYLTTLGIPPTRAETGYGYIKAGDALGEGLHLVAQFTEKPDKATATEFYQSGAYTWNAGIFLFKACAMSAELQNHAPDVFSSAQRALLAARIENEFIHLNKEHFQNCPAISIDYAVMEKTSLAAVSITQDIGWSDIGSWAAVAENQRGQEQSQMLQIDCKDTIIQSDGPFVATIGTEDLIIVATKDAILVSHKGRTQDVKKIVDELKARKRDDLL